MQTPTGKVGSGEGFRMPARSYLLARALRAGVRKPPRKEPAGRQAGGYRLWGFDGAAGQAGDEFTGVVGGSRTIAAAILSLERWSRGDFGLIDGASYAFGDGGATAMQSRKRSSPAGGVWAEVVTGVTALRWCYWLGVAAGREVRRRA